MQQDEKPLTNLFVFVDAIGHTMTMSQSASDMLMMVQFQSSVKGSVITGQRQSTLWAPALQFI